MFQEVLFGSLTAFSSKMATIWMKFLRNARHFTVFSFDLNENLSEIFDECWNATGNGPEENAGNSRSPKKVESPGKMKRSALLETVEMHNKIGNKLSKSRRMKCAKLLGFLADGCNGWRTLPRDKYWHDPLVQPPPAALLLFLTLQFLDSFNLISRKSSRVFHFFLKCSYANEMQIEIDEINLHEENMAEVNQLI